MSGFGNFTSGTSGGGLFDPNKSTGFAGFGTPAATTTSGLTFGTNTFGSPAPNLFGTNQPSTNFGPPGTGLTAPNASTGTGFTFGTATPSLGAPGFGATTTVAPFGASTSTTPFGAPTSTATFGVGTSTAPFGAGTSAAPFSATTSTAPFGAATSTAPFGTAPLSFGAPKTTASLNFGTATTSTAPAPAFNFGTATTATTNTGLGFGITPSATTQSTGFSLTQPTTTASSLFNVPKTTGGFSFSTTATATTTSSTPGLNFGLATTNPASTGFSLGGLGTSSALTTSSLITSVGLGGVDNLQTRTGLAGPGTSEPKQVKDNALPEPLLQSLNDFQNFTKQQKSISVEISHGSSKPLKKVQEDIEALESLLATIASGLTRNAIAVDKLKSETAQGLHQAELAQRNNDAAPGLDYDSSAPAEYFNDLVTKFETDTMRLRVQIEASEKHLKSLTQSSTISPQELTLAMKRLHETLIVLAARVQTLHTSVQSQKEQYKNLRRVYFKDDSNIFEQDADQTLTKKPNIYSLRSLTGPTPFSETPGGTANLNVDGLAMLAGSTVTSIVTTTSNPSWITSLQGTPNTSSILPPSTNVLTTPPLAENSSSFQLSKPPVGNKRNKR